MDIVERLRELSALEKSFPMSGTCWYEKAADEIERLRKRVELLEGYLNGALNVIEGFVPCDTTKARKALEEKE